MIRNDILFPNPQIASELAARLLRGIARNTNTNLLNPTMLLLKKVFETSPIDPIHVQEMYLNAISLLGERPNPPVEVVHALLDAGKDIAEFFPRKERYLRGIQLALSQIGISASEPKFIELNSSLIEAAIRDFTDIQQREIFQLRLKQPGCSAEEIAETTNHPAELVGKIIARLQHDGYLIPGTMIHQ